MRIKFYAHASFRLEGDGLAVVTDPYTPGPGGSGFDPIDEAADIVIRSSDTDDFHCNASHVRGEPEIIDALYLPEAGTTVKGLHIRALPVMENLSQDLGRPARDNAMYSFTLGGVRVLDLGDIGNPFSDEHLAMLAGQVDLMLALSGGQPTIALDDLEAAIQVIRPRAVIPMHYYHPRGVLDILPVTAFVERYPAEEVTWVGGPELSLSPQSLPAGRHIYVLEQCR
jgi:L-ascorbate metabolism protein UlaG (beta-lactamase superfamily)